MRLDSERVIRSLIGVLYNDNNRLYIKDAKRTRKRMYRNAAHAAGQLPMSSAYAMNARKCVHSKKKNYLSQAVAYELRKVGRRGKETGKTEARRLMERSAA